jgi:predicted GNAT family N-acyltransferase
MNISIQNMVGFYNAIGRAGHVQHVENEHFGAITEAEGFWPQLIYRFGFNNNPEQNIAQEMGALAKGESRMNAICSVQQLAELDVEKLRSAHVFPIEMWETMETKTFPFHGNDDELYKFKQLFVNEELAAFTSLVNTDMMRNLKIRDNFFTTLAKESGFKFYGLFAENELVSALLVFTENGVGGLYFIVSKAAWRMKGLAGNLIRKTLARMFENGTENVVLQAVNKAIPLYSRIGFQSTGKLVILMKY